MTKPVTGGVVQLDTLPATFGLEYTGVNYYGTLRVTKTVTRVFENYGDLYIKTENAISKTTSIDCQVCSVTSCFAQKINSVVQRVSDGACLDKPSLEEISMITLYTSYLYLNDKCGGVADPGVVIKFKKMFGCSDAQPLPIPIDQVTPSEFVGEEFDLNYVDGEYEATLKYRKVAGGVSVYGTIDRDGGEASVTEVVIGAFSPALGALPIFDAPVPIYNSVGGTTGYIRNTSVGIVLRAFGGGYAIGTIPS
jgi:hypothetical protein